VKGVGIRFEGLSADQVNTAWRWTSRPQLFYLYEWLSNSARALESALDLARTTDIATQLCAKLGWEGPEYIDHGNSAAVYRVVHPEYGRAALKVYDPVFFEGENALIESNRVALQEELKGHGHPNLIEILETAEVSEFGTWYLLMEFCPWASLEKRLADVPDDRIHHLLKQLTEAVRFLETKGLVHRDIKPANIVVSPDFDSLKLLDLGVLRKIAPEEGSGTDSDEKKRFIATAQYSPPEYLTREELPGAKGFTAINVYQIGAVLHDLIMKDQLFREDADTQNKYILYKAVTGKKPRIANPNVSVRLIGLCAQALDKDPARRVANVKLEDFLADADDSETIRRRLSGARPQQTRPTTPSLHVWRPRVRAWITTAARQEREALGTFTVPQTDLPGGSRWTLNFDKAGQVHVELAVASPVLVVRVISETIPPVSSTVCEITDEGPDLSSKETEALLKGQILYSLDLAMHFEASTSKVGTGGAE
jgi:serine/threonine protein kinase